MNSSIFIFLTLTVFFGLIILFIFKLNIFSWNKKLLFNQFITLFLILILCFCYSYSTYLLIVLHTI